MHRLNPSELPHLEEGKKYVLIDTDAGTDDAHAILMALRAHSTPSQKFEVVGITCVSGNTAVDNVCVNVTNILNINHLLGKIPIYRGAEHPLISPLTPDDPPFHGYNGFGDAELGLKAPKLEPEHGVSAIIKAAHMFKNQLTILAFGPLTNLALAVRMDPSIKDLVKDIYAMGGNMEGVGNVTVCAEFNFHVDPEAAFITLSTFSCPITIVPWEVCDRQGTQTHAWRIKELGKLDTPGASLLNAIEESTILKGGEKTQRWIPCDQLAAAVLIHPRVIKSSVEIHCTVELHGTHTRGLMILDHNSVLKKSPNVRVINEIDPEILRALLLWGVGGPEFI